MELDLESAETTSMKEYEPFEFVFYVILSLLVDAFIQNIVIVEKIFTLRHISMVTCFIPAGKCWKSLKWDLEIMPT